MIDHDRCDCGHPPSEHVHRLLECYCCDCPIFHDQNELEDALSADALRGYLHGQQRRQSMRALAASPQEEGE